jgi:hypothetical protein
MVTAKKFWRGPSFTRCTGTAALEVVQYLLPRAITHSAGPNSFRWQFLGNFRSDILWSELFGICILTFTTVNYRVSVPSVRTSFFFGGTSTMLFPTARSSPSLPHLH